MSMILSCCGSDVHNEAYIGVDGDCREPAIFCIEHNPHKNKQGLLHQMLPLAQFKRSINEKKFQMEEIVCKLTDTYSDFMDKLIEEIKELKLRKSIELSMLWLRQLCRSQEEYQIMRKVYRMDFSGLTCSQVHDLYFKIIHHDIYSKKKVQDIDCYKGVAEVLHKLENNLKAKLIINQKILELEGIMQSGELLKRALPDRKVLRQNTKEILLDALNPKLFDIKYNKVILKTNSRSYQSVLSKYPLVEHTNYHLFMKTKYANIMIGICSDTLRNQADSNDLHYHLKSIVYNCSNGCVYRDGMFQNNANNLTKGQKAIDLQLQILQNQMILFLGKNILCRTQIQSLKSSSQKLYLHLLMRTEGDQIQIERDKVTATTATDNMIVEERYDNFKEEARQIVQYEVESKDFNEKSLGSITFEAEDNHLFERSASKRKVQFNIEESPLKQSYYKTSPNQQMPIIQINSIKQPFKSVKRQNNREKSNQIMKESIKILESNREQNVSIVKDSIFQKHDFMSPILQKDNSHSEKNSIVHIDQEYDYEISPAESRYLHQDTPEIKQSKLLQHQNLLRPDAILPLRKSQFSISAIQSDVRNTNLSKKQNSIVDIKMAPSELAPSVMGGTFRTLRKTQHGDDWL